MSLNLPSNKFHYTLDVMTSCGISLSSDSIHLSKENNVVSEVALPSVLNFLEDNASFLDKKDIPNLEKLRDRFAQAAPDEFLKQKVQLEFAKHIFRAKTNIEKELPPIPPHADILICVREKPTNQGELLENFRLVLNNHPRYQLNTDLSVIDTIHNCFPKDLDPYRRYEALKKSIDSLDNSTKETNQAEFHALLDLYKPREVVQFVMIVHPEIGETNEAGQTTTAMRDDALNALNQNLPLLMTKALLHTHKDSLEKALKEKAVFVQENGGSLLVLPKRGKPEEYGFSTTFQPVLGTTETIPVTPFNYVSDLKEVFIDEENLDHGFYRIAFISGHGDTPSETSEGHIAALPFKQFQEGLKVLKDNHMIFLGVQSCFSGANIPEVHLPIQQIKTLESDGIPFSILIENATESVTKTGGLGLKKCLDEARAQLCSSATLHKNPVVLALRTPTQQKLEEIAKQLPRFYDDEALSNLPTALLPSQGDIPKAAYAPHPTEFLYGDNKAKVFDISRSLNQQIRAEPKKEPVLQDNDNQGVAYVFSNPIVPATLESKQALPLLMSRGGTAHHVIREIKMEQATLSYIVISPSVQFPYANKAYAIGKMRCLLGEDSDKGSKPKPVIRNLEHVLIINNRKNCGVIFRLEEDKNRYYYLDKDALNASRYTWPLTQGVVELSPDQAAMRIYNVLANTQPSAKALTQMTAGRQSESDFYDAINTYFWQEEPLLEERQAPPLAAKVMRSILDNQSNFEKQKDGKLKVSSSFEDALKELDETLPANEENKSKRAEILNTALLMACSKNKEDLALRLLDMGADASYLDPSDNTPVFFKVIESDNLPILNGLITHGFNLNTVNSQGRTPLMQAIQRQKFPLAERILQEKGLDLNHEDLGSFTALHYAIYRGNTQMIDLLIKNGADTQQKALEEKCDLLSFAIKVTPQEDKKRVVELLLNYVKNFNQQDQNGNTPMHHAILNGEYEIARLLLASGANAEIKNDEQKTARDLAAIEGEVL